MYAQAGRADVCWVTLRAALWDQGYMMGVKRPQSIVPGNRDHKLNSTRKYYLEMETGPVPSQGGPGP
jgi:hypothetical protein